MRVIHIKDAETYEPEKGWMRACTCHERSVSLEYFIKPPGHASSLHEHACEQVGVVIKGKMKVRNARDRECAR